MTETTRLTEALIDRAGHGDDTARRELLERYRDYLRRMVATRLDRRLAPRVDPSDIVQETLADAAQRLDDYLRDRPIPFFGWLRQIAGERVIDAHRRHVLSQRRSITREMRTPELSEESAGELGRRLMANDTSPSNRLIRKERHEQVMAALTALSPRDREVLVMRHLEQLGTAEIADALGLTEGAVESCAPAPCPDPPAGQDGGRHMTDPDECDRASEADDPALARLAEQVTCRLQAGDEVVDDEYVRQYPARAGSIRGLLYVLNDLTALGRLMSREPVLFRASSNPGG